MYAYLLLALALSFGAQAQNNLQMTVHVVDQNNQPVPNWVVQIQAYGSQNFYVSDYLTTNVNGRVDTMLSYPSGLTNVYAYGFTRSCNGNWAGVGDTLSAGGALSLNDTIVINCPSSANCNLSFTSSYGSINPNIVSFTPSFTRPSNTQVSYTIDYGDGTNGTNPNAPHTYSQTGRYYVCMTATAVDSNFNLTLCTATYCDSVLISSTSPNHSCSASLNANASPVTGNPYRAWIQYQTGHNGIPAGGSINRIIYYGDGDSAVAGASGAHSHTYPGPGSYTVCVKVELRDASNNVVCSSIDCDSIYFAPSASVNCSANLNVSINPNYQYSINVNSSGSTVQNAPMGAQVRYHYNFGDGNTKITFPNVNTSHYYSQPGTYAVSLNQVVSSGSGTVLCSSTDYDTITIAPVNCNASFFIDTATSGNGTVYMWNNSTWDSSASVTNVTWYWGDGDTSFTMFPTHVYSSPGTYIVCLYLQTNGPNGPCTDYFCDTLSVDSAGNIIMKNGNAFTVVVQDPATIGVEEEAVAHLELYPNPADDYITIKGQLEGEVQWQLIDIRGTMVAQGSTRSNGNENLTVDVSAYPTGMYILRVKDDRIIDHFKIKLDR